MTLLERSSARVFRGSRETNQEKLYVDTYHGTTLKRVWTETACDYKFVGVCAGSSGSLGLFSTRFALAWTNQVSKTWEEVASVDVVGESVVIRRYEGGNISLKAGMESSR